MVSEWVQILLTLSVLAVGLAHLYLDQFSTDSSDIQIFTNPDQVGYGPLKRGRMELYFQFTANNRGDDNGYIDSGRLTRFEFSMTEDFSDPHTVDAGSFGIAAEADVGYPPRVSLKQDDEYNHDSPLILVPEGQIARFGGECVAHTDNLKDTYAEYNRMRAIVEFECRDTSGEYTRETSTGIIDVWDEDNYQYGQE